MTETINCSNCQKQHRAEATFCSGCGAKFAPTPASPPHPSAASHGQATAQPTGDTVGAMAFAQPPQLGAMLGAGSFAVGLPLPTNAPKTTEAQPPPPTPVAQQPDVVQEVHELIAAGNNEQAAARATQALISDPTNASLLWSKGYAYMRLGNTKEAKEAFSANLRVKPDDLGARLLLANVLEAEGQWQQVLELLSPVREQEMEPVHRTGLEYSTGRSLSRLHRFDEAAVALSAALALASNDEMREAVLLELGVAQLDGGHAAEGAVQLEAARALNPGNAQVSFQLACAYSVLQQSDKSFARLSHAIQLVPEFQTSAREVDQLEYLRSHDPDRFAQLVGG